jgi:hypothetical protein
MSKGDASQRATHVHRDLTGACAMHVGSDGKKFMAVSQLDL